MLLVGLGDKSRFQVLMRMLRISSPVVPLDTSELASKVSVISQQMRYFALSAHPYFGCQLVSNNIFVILRQAELSIEETITFV